MSRSARELSAPRKVAVLFSMYFVQGLPYGFQITALPVYLREQGTSLTAIGLAYALSAPWMLKLLWGPLVDRYGSDRIGRRRSWILPTQLGIVLGCVAAAVLTGSGLDGRLAPLMAMILVMNLCAATMDVAVDGLAVDLLKRRELGYGNIAQVVGYKFGMLFGGGVLLWASTRIGWSGLFAAMALLAAAALGVSGVFREPPPPEDGRGRPSLGEIVQAASRAMRLPGTLWIVLAIGTYKLGETMADVMFRPFLVDAGFDAAQIGLWVGTWGMAFSLAGSLLGGMLASRLPFVAAVALAASVRVLPLAGELWLSLQPHPTANAVLAVTASEHFFGGMLTTTMFAFMMSRVDRRIGATHYTLLATLEVLGKAPGGWVSGWIADRWNYPAVFGLAVALSVLYLLTLVPANRAVKRSEPFPS